MSITYREATMDDVDLLASTRVSFLEGISGAMGDEDKETILRNNRTYMQRALAEGMFAAYLAFDGDVLAGTSGICFYSVMPNSFNPTGNIAYIQNMYTVPEYRRQGIATKLFAMSLELAKARGYAKFYLNATDQGRLLYEKYGFVDAVNEMVLSAR